MYQNYQTQYYALSDISMATTTQTCYETLIVKVIVNDPKKQSKIITTHTSKHI